MNGCSSLHAVCFGRLVLFFFAIVALVYFVYLCTLFSKRVLMA